MKLDARRIEGFLDAPGRYRVALLYGDDAGLIRERAERLVRAVAGTLDDPFRISDLEKGGSGRVVDEMASGVLTGGRRVVRVRDVDDSALAQVQAVLARPGEGFLVLEGPGLTARGKLRGAMERAADAVAIGCYAPERPALEQIIGRTLANDAVTVDPDARTWLADQLGADTALTLRELEKLSLYAGAGGRVDLDAARQCVGDLAGLSMDDALFAATDGNVAETDRAVELALASGGTPVGMLRVAMGHLHRLQRARLAMADGASAMEAAKAARPPVFFRREPAFVRALGLWSAELLRAAAQRLWDAERMCKLTGYPAEILCRSALVGLAQRAAMLRRR